ncbi:MAG: hypothetical protein OXB86_02590 [Bdellovibrionales bacterium]|nr:hypothetical protein [Bdellovibrionales bacterium]
MKYLTYAFLSVFFLSNLPMNTIAEEKSYEKINLTSGVAFIPAAPKNIENESSETQVSQKINPKNNCRYFLTTGLENDTLFAIGSHNSVDDGYTHGHLTRLTKSCDSGVDLSIALDSRLFTDFYGFKISPEDEIIVTSFFEEENRLNVEYTDWRNFSKSYQSVGLTVGHLSRNKRRFAGLEQELFHKLFGSTSRKDVKISYRRKSRTLPKDETSSRLEPVEQVIDDLTSDITEYEYLPQDKNKEFFGGRIAFGKSYSLDDLGKICAKQCADYFRTEAGLEFISLKYGSNIYIFSEIDKSLPQPLKAFSLFASIKIQKNEGGSSYNENSLGLKYSFSGFQLHFIFKKRNLPEGGNPIIEYDTDEDNIVFFGLQIPF